MNDQPQPRSRSQRRGDALRRLRGGGNLWLATAGAQGRHLIPVSFFWDGERLTTSTFDNSRTLANVRAQPRVRASIGSTTDVLMVDATATVLPADAVQESTRAGYARISGIPMATPGFTYVQLRPERMQVWRGPGEVRGRTVMRKGMWLADEAP